MSFQVDAGDFYQFNENIRAYGADMAGGKGAMQNKYIIRVEKDLIVTASLSSGNELHVLARLKASDTKKGTVCVNDAGELAKILKRFNGKDRLEVSGTTVEGKLVVRRGKPRLRFEVQQADNSPENFPSQETADQYINTITVDPPVMNGKTFPIKIVTKAEQILEAIKDGELIKQRHFPLTAYADDDGNHLSVSGASHDNDSKFDREIEAVVLRSDSDFVVDAEKPAPILPIDETSAEFSAGFDSVFRNLSGPIIIFLANESPMMVVSDNNKLFVRYVLAPINPEAEEEDLDDDFEVDFDEDD